MSHRRLFKRPFLLFLGVLGATALGQLAWLAAAARDAGVTSSAALEHGAIVAICAPLAVSIVICGSVGSLLATWRVRELVAAFDAVATGNFDVRMQLSTPVAPALRVVNDAFARMGEDLEKLTQRLAGVDAQRRRLFSDLAHELATPSAAILGLVDTIARPDLVPTDEARAPLLVTLEQEALRLARLVEDLRDLARLEDPDVTFTRERADVARAVEGAVERFRLIQPAGAMIAVHARTAFADVDASRIEQTLINLLRNAKRYAPASGSIDVDVGPSSGGVTLVVENGGEPLAPEILARLGERLFRGDPSRTQATGGAGLGLAIVRSIVHRHGGTIDFANGPKGGLRVTVVLPASGVE
jgi:signal transduction histidine kinase